MACSWTPVKLGRTGLEVVPLGLAAAYGIPGRDVERAFERGLNLFYWGSRRTPDFGRALRRIAGRDRGKVVTVIQSYARAPSLITFSLESALRALGLDYTDVLLLGWWNRPPPERILATAADLVRRGRARHLMISCHHRPTFPLLARDPRVDLVMTRYNAAHPGAEQDVFPHLPQEKPGVVAYTTTSWGQLLDPALAPAGERVPRSTDCYRYVLSNRHVDACWAGPKNAAQLDDAMRALDLGPMSEDELAWMRRVGESVHTRTRLLTHALSLSDRVALMLRLALSGADLVSSLTLERKDASRRDG
jgi:aryl-alcohol dehydrogenase-like predicted oxidoreductase